MIGETIGNFRLIKRLGSGGMGEVYLAEHKDMQTPVAVKLLNSEISNNHDHCQRFFNEARVVSKIKHAGTVKIFDSGFFNDQAYLIMELLEGESLAGRIDRVGAMAVPHILDIGRQIASVLDATHRQGVIHRDLKPDNIFLVVDDERASGERVKVLDFGIAKLSGTLAAVSPKTSGTMGTPAYMAPEQWGDSGKVDWRADAYSLGCVMFEMATGRPPFHATNIAEAFTKHLMETPPTPSSLSPAIPPPLDALILRLLAKEPADRAVSMGQVTRELAELAGEPMPRMSSDPGIRVTPTPYTPPPGASTPTNTTLGGSVGQMQAQPAARRRLGIVAGVALTAVAAVVTAAVISASKGDNHATAPAAKPAAVPTAVPTAAPSAQPTAVPAAAPSEPTPAPAAAAAPELPPPTPPTPAVAEGSAALATQPAAANPTEATKPTTTDKPKPTTAKPKPKATTPAKPKPGAGSGSDKPPVDDGGWGGRL